jgi:dissimilatory sulfite reductase related protein
MATLQVGGRTLKLTDEGFLSRSREWNDDVAVALARCSDGICTLSDEHWIVIRFIRDHFLRYRHAPLVRALCEETGLSLKRIYELFPSGPAKGACKIAGLPRPDGCV